MATLAPPLLRRTTTNRRFGSVYPQTPQKLQSAITALISPSGLGDKARLGNLLEEAMVFAVGKTDGRMLDWLMALDGDAAEILNSRIPQITDEDGYDLVSLSVIASASTTREEKEDFVRTLVRKWGLPSISHTPHSSPDPASTPSALLLDVRPRASWTPLHLASLLSSPPLVSFLLTQGASPFVTTRKGLTPLDLIADMEHRQDVAILLKHAMDAAEEERGITTASFTGSNLDEQIMDSAFKDVGEYSPEESGEENGYGNRGTQPKMEVQMQRYRENKVRAVEKENRRNRKRSEQDHQDAFIIDKMKGCLGMGMDQGVRYLLHTYGKRAGEKKQRLGVEEEMDLEDEEAEEDGLEVGMNGSDGLNGGGIGRQVINEDMDDSFETNNGDEEPKDVADVDDSSFLAWPVDKLDTFLDIVIASYPAQRYPVERRTLPANALYLLARFAAYRCGESWLITVLEQATLTIEQVCLRDTNDICTLSFWTYNVTILLYLIEGDSAMEEACEQSDLTVMLQEMLNALQVHIIRFAEERIDRILEPSLLDFEASDETADVQFTDEWNFLKSLTGKSKKRTVNPHVANLFAPLQQEGSNPTTPPRRVMSESGSPMARDLSIRSSLLNLRNEASASPSASIRSLATMVGGGPETILSPLSIVNILYGTHLVLQSYEVNPALIIQIFSQIMLWISSEVFNRIITQGKKLLCRSKAGHVKRNLAILEDWIRQSDLPISIYTIHFERVLQLLDWLQCSSQLKEMDMLIAATQHLKALNPLQLRKALKDYRYELNEPKMSDECVQYLSQMQRDWERQRVRRGVDAIQRQVDARRSGGQATGEAMDLDLVDETAPIPSDIDSLFDLEKFLSDYIPSMAPKCLGELQDSKHMLPLVLPSSRYLPAVPGRKPDGRNPVWGVSSGPLHTHPAVLDPGPGPISSRHTSSTSIKSGSPMLYSIPKDDKLRRIPDDFIDRLSQADKLADTRTWVFSAREEELYTPVPHTPLPPSRPQPLALHESSVHNLGTPIMLQSDSFQSPSAGSAIKEPISPTPQSATIRGAIPPSPTRSTASTGKSWWGKMRTSSQLSRDGSEDGEDADVSTEEGEGRSERG